MQEKSTVSHECAIHWAEFGEQAVEEALALLLFPANSKASIHGKNHPAPVKEDSYFLSSSKTCSQKKSSHAAKPQSIKKRAKCPLCASTFARKYDIDRHIQSKHSNKSPAFSCGICHKRFVRKDTLSKHQKSCNPNFACELLDGNWSGVVSTSELTRSP
jgi:hypothetical protein